ncbi:MAG: bifunctional riboflavin kinase/FAD synthetase [Planctomycetota bacterium]
MRIVESKEQLDQVAKGQVLTIGNFDGVHIGHRAIIKGARTQAEQRGTALVVMTFDPHPAAILHPEKAPGVLTPLGLKRNLLEQQGADFLIVVRDSFELLNLSPEDFVDEFLMRTIQPCAVVEGPNFNFGYGRSGDIETLKELGVERDFDVVVVAAQQINLGDGSVSIASSSLVRNLLEAGRVSQASAVLGRNYKLIGKVIEGRGIGTQIGFPTANIEPLNQIIPAEGVYAGFVEIADNCADIFRPQKKLPAVFSIGRAKTFVKEHRLLIEAHLLGDVGVIYDKYLAMDFVEFLRHQQRFESHERLAEQIEKDCQKAGRILAERPGSKTITGRP